MNEDIEQDETAGRREDGQKKVTQRRKEEKEIKSAGSTTLRKDKDRLIGICRHCGSPTVLLGAKFCPECGKPFPEARDDPATWRTTKKTGTCRICGYQPVAFDAPTCPSCGGKSPNPGTASRFTGRGALIGFMLGGSSGALIGLISGGNSESAFIGFLMGNFFGIFAGFVIGALVGGVISGMRGE